MEEPGKISSAIQYISPGDNKTFTNKIQVSRVAAYFISRVTAAYVTVICYHQDIQQFKLKKLALGTGK
jgi:hypothetical protein